jgi:hypothetical protein
MSDDGKNTSTTTTRLPDIRAEVREDGVRVGDRACVRSTRRHDQAAEDATRDPRIGAHSDHGSN